ncbi:O-antigen ligase family protein [Desulfobulbus propionicus]
MKINIQKVIKYISNIAFFLLFPGFFLYQSALGLGYIQPVIGGYFGVMAAALHIPLLLGFLYVFVKNFNNFQLIDGLFWAIIILTVAVSLYNYADGKLAGNMEMLKWSFTGLLFNIVCYSMTKTVDLSLPMIKIGLAFVLTVMIYVVLKNSIDGFFYLKQQSEINFLASYQGFARSISIIGLLMIGLIEKNTIKIIVFTITVILLFLNGSRSEFILFICSFLFFLITKQSINIKKFCFLFILLIALVQMIYLFFNYIIDFFPNIRMVQIFDIINSTSGQKRLELLNNALDEISKNPIFGNYGSYVTDDQGTGFHSHNLLSAWVNLGLMGFILYVSSVFLMLFGSINKLRREPSSSDAQISLLFSFFVAGSFLVSKDYTYMIFGMTVGFYSNLCCRKRM